MTQTQEQEQLGEAFARGGFPRLPPHDESAECREAWLRGYDRAKLGDAALAKAEE